MLKTMCCTAIASTLCVGAAFAQPTNPTPRAVPFTENFGAAGSATAPTGFAAWNGVSGGSTSTQALAEASAPTGNATITTTTPATTGGSYYYAVSGDARLAVIQSSNATNGVNQWIVALNTTGQSNLTLTYDLIYLNAAARTLGVVAQYRVGNTGTWTTLPAVTGNPYIVSSGISGTVTPVSVPLPAAVDNLAEVQIRFATWRGTEAGASAGYALDNLSVLAGGATTGACCNGGSCSITTQAGCSGVFQTLGSTCTPDPCVSFQIGACCVNGFCVGDLTSSACLANGAGSTWGGNGTSCGSFSCPAPSGACCNGTACTTTTQANCTGTWTLNGACTPTNPCDPAEACCFANGSCLLRPTVDCGTLGGTPNGAGTTCTPTNPCPQPPPSACCTGATCALSPDPLTCFNSGGQFKGYGTTCTPSPCFVASGTVIATYDFDTNVVGNPATNLSFTPVPDNTATNGTFSNAFDIFGVTDRTVNGDVADDSVAVPTDTVGILRSTQTSKVFGVEDLLNPDNASGGGSATFTFNVAGFTNLNLSVDCAAFGNFEQLGSGAGSVGDSYKFSVSIDGGTPTDVIVSNIYEGITPTYTLENGNTNVLTNDPCAMNGAIALNQFVTFAAPISGAGSTLTLTFNATNDGGGEVFLFDNVVIRGTAGAVNGACCSGTTCSVLASGACTGANTSYKGDGTVCNVPGNNTTPCCRADFNQSGAVTVQDIFDFLAAYFTSNAQADINGAGGVTVQDIFDFLAAYFTGCV
jgi:hypothetical protein